MSWFPPPPTDNLYKFMAISGIYLLLGLVAFFSWMGYMQLQIERESARSLSYFSSLRVAPEIEARLSALESNHPTEDRLDWVPAGTSIEREKKLLNTALAAHRKNIRENEDVLDNEIGEEFALLKAMGIYWIGPLYVLAAVALPYFGFTRWYRKVQLPNEEAHAIDCRLKEATIRKLQVETRKTACHSGFGGRKQQP